MRKHTLRLVSLLALGIVGTSQAVGQTYEDAIDCIAYIDRVSLQLEYGSDADKQAKALREGWQTTASLLAEDGADPDALKKAASDRFWDVMRNGTGADKQAYHQSFNKCAAPPAISATPIPAKNCARFALYLKENEESTRTSWQSHLVKLADDGAPEEEISEAQAKLKLHNENAKRAYRIHSAWKSDNVGVRLEADPLGVYDLNERADVITACEAG